MVQRRFLTLSAGCLLMAAEPGLARTREFLPVVSNISSSQTITFADAEGNGDLDVIRPTPCPATNGSPGIGSIASSESTGLSR